MQLSPMVYLLTVIEVPKDCMHKSEECFSLQTLHIIETENSS